MISEIIRNCQQCPLGQRDQCNCVTSGIQHRKYPDAVEFHGPVPAKGPTDAKIMFIGEAPGRKEDEQHLPFVGPTGDIFNNLLQDIALSVNSVYITNVVKCRPPRNKTPSLDQGHVCGSAWLPIELQMVQPYLVVLMGKVAASYLLNAPDLTLSDYHGRVWEDLELVGGYTAPRVLVVHHPAATIYDPNLDRTIREDFAYIPKLLAGSTAADLLTKDAYPDPHYELIESPTLISRLTHQPQVAVDTETLGLYGELFSVQLSPEPGTGYVIPVDVWRAYVAETGYTFPESTLAIYHNYLYDQNYVTAPNVMDTMVMAYLIGYPQGLKTLAREMCGMSMLNLGEILQGPRAQLAREYLEAAAQTNWPTGGPYYEEKWDKKAGRLAVKTRKPVAINKKITKILAEMISKNTDPWERWHKIEQEERAPIEDQLGLMPEANMSHLDPQVAFTYSAKDPDATMRVYQALEPLIVEKGIYPVLYAQDLPILPIIAEMMRNGLPLNTTKLFNLSRDIWGTLQDLQDQMTGMVKVQVKELTETANYIQSRQDGTTENYDIGGLSTFNPNSSAQRAHVLYSLFGFEPTGKTKSGVAPSTNEKQLAKVDHPIARLMTKYVKAMKVKSTYTDKLPNFAKDDRLYYRILTTSVSTGRISTRDPNVMAIPNRSDLGQKVRDTFEMPPGQVFLGIDYGQIEMRVAAHVSNCISMIQLMREGRDIHTETAAEIYKIPLEEAKNPTFRYPVKTFGFGVLYMLSAAGLLDLMISEGIKGWDIQKCRDFISDYFKLRPEIKAWQKHTIEQARKDGYVRDMFGRIRLMPTLSSPIRSIKSEAERNTVNMPIQSGAQGVIKLAMVKLWQMYGHIEGVQWLLQNHDELIWQVDDQLIASVVPPFKDVMKNIISLQVPLEVEAKVGTTWANMQVWE